MLITLDGKVYAPNKRHVSYSLNHTHMLPPILCLWPFINGMAVEMLFYSIQIVISIKSDYFQFEFSCIALSCTFGSSPHPACSDDFQHECAVKRCTNYVVQEGSVR